jgi:hypothetical protein
VSTLKVFQVRPILIDMYDEGVLPFALLKTSSSSLVDDVALRLDSLTAEVLQALANHLSIPCPKSSTIVEKGRCILEHLGLLDSHKDVLDRMEAAAAARKKRKSADYDQDANEEHDLAAGEDRPELDPEEPDAHQVQKAEEPDANKAQKAEAKAKDLPAIPVRAEIPHGCRMWLTQPRSVTASPRWQVALPPNEARGKASFSVAFEPSTVGQEAAVSAPNKKGQSATVSEGAAKASCVRWLWEWHAIKTAAPIAVPVAEVSVKALGSTSTTAPSSVAKSSSSSSSRSSCSSSSSCGRGRSAL